MEYICDAPGDRTWFRLVSEGEAAMESELMRHAVEKYFRREWEKAAESFTSADLGLHRAGYRQGGAYPARDAAVPDVARR